MKTIIINGLWICERQKITGIERACRELIMNLDENLSGSKLNVYYVYYNNYPNIVVDPAKLKNIKPFGFDKSNRFMDRTRIIRKVLKEKKGILCNMSLETIYAFKQIYFIYDIRPLETHFDNKQFKKGFKQIIFKERPFIKYICTDSYYQRERISKKLHFNKKKITVFYMGYEHISELVSDKGIFKKHPILLEKSFYYSVGSVAPHKNYRWILNTAKNNPDSIFAIAGNVDPELSRDYNIDPGSLKNVVYLGYVSDEESKALMEKCAGFLHPSKYEGFGIPPLEALACGAKIAISNSTCLPEVYEDSAIYFDPDDYNVNIEELFKNKVSSPEKILEKCSWKKSGLDFLHYLEEVVGR